MSFLHPNGYLAARIWLPSRPSSVTSLSLSFIKLSDIASAALDVVVEPVMLGCVCNVNDEVVSDAKSSSCGFLVGRATTSSGRGGVFCEEAVPVFVVLCFDPLESVPLSLLPVSFPLLSLDKDIEKFSDGVGCAAKAARRCACCSSYCSRILRNHVRPRPFGRGSALGISTFFFWFRAARLMRACLCISSPILPENKSILVLIF
mmetsp:Transcript_8654/g.12654  ORF Transcript_8654/g.12654 Transcript_8654/m.12654 type:complete len:204 (+) Transcript_8654:1134-1745(+)